MENKVGLDINLSGTPSSWMTINPSISLVHTHANGKYQGINLHVDDFSWSGNLELNLNSKKHTEFQSPLSPINHQQKYHNSKLKRITILTSNQTGFFNNRLQVSFSVSDVFDHVRMASPFKTQTPIAWQITVKKPLTLTGSG